MAMKPWIWLFFIVTIIGGIGFFYIDFFYYAGVIDAGIFVAPLIVQVFLGVYAILKKEKTYIKAGFLIFICSIIIYVIAIPGNTYEQAEQSVVDRYKMREVKLLSLDHQTVPTDTSSWFQHDKMYYVAVEADEVDYYAVDPNQGDPIRLEEPYWQHSE